VGLDQFCYDSIRKCDQEVRKELYNNIVLCGGSSLFDGIQERIWQDLHTLAPSTAKIKVVAPPDRKFSVWWGASILSSLSFF
jgi:actin-related protein